MCPIQPLALLSSIAENPEAPQDIRHAAGQRLSQNLVNAAIPEAAAIVNVSPSTGTSDFTCAIFSMNNKDFLRGKKLAASGTTEVEITNQAEVGKFPGDLVQNTKGFVVRNADGSVMADDCRQRCFEGLRATWNFYKTHFNRNSIDGQGVELGATIHLSRGYDNAFWDPTTKWMCFGDGGRFDGRGWLMPDPNVRDAKTLTNWHAPYSLDVIGHELTHGVVSATIDLGGQQLQQYQFAAYSEAGTLNEHIADCFGMMIKHFSEHKTAKTGNWDMAPGWYSQIALDASKWTRDYLRTFRKPDLSIEKVGGPAPKHMKDLVPFVQLFIYPTDPHTNVGIPNHAFYLAAQAFDGYTWDNVGKIWYAALADETFKAPKAQTFRGWAELTTRHAQRLVPPNGEKIMKDAWKQVGIVL